MNASKFIDLVSTSCSHGNYVVLSPELIKMIDNELDLQTSCMISDAIKHLKHRYSGLIRQKVPSVFRDSTNFPKKPFGIENVYNSCYVNAMIQIFMMVDPVRAIYVRGEWRHGVPGVLEIESPNIQSFAKDFHTTMSRIFRSILKGETEGPRFISTLEQLRSIAHPTDSHSKYSQENVSEILGRIFSSVDTDDKQLSPHPAFVSAFDSLRADYMDVYGNFNHVKLVGIAVPPSFKEGWSLVDVLNPTETGVLSYNHDVMMSTPQIHSFAEFGAYLMIGLERGGIDDTISAHNCGLPYHLSIKLLSGSRTQFELIAIVERIHSSMRSGHYYVHTKYADKWYLINDAHVHEEESPILSHMVEILLFKKIK